MNKAVFLDRDGTINIDYGYVYKYEDFKFVDGAIEAMKMLKQAGYLLIVITNQSGIARGYFSEEDFKILNEKLAKYLKGYGITIDAVYHCPHLNEGCTCRKPATGLFYRAAEKFNIDFSKSFAIGDRMRDLSICMEQPVKGYLISGNDKMKKESIQVVSTLLGAANEICNGSMEKKND